MLTYTFEKHSGVSLYEQLYRHIKEDILSGRLTAGEKLPSKRTLSSHLELSVITVKNAYEQLIAEGYIYSEEKRGYFVSRIERPLRPGKATALPEREADGCLAELKGRIPDAAIVGYVTEKEDSYIILE